MENQKGSVRGKALSLSDMASAFVILSLGTSFAFLVFLVERILPNPIDIPMLLKL